MTRARLPAFRVSGHVYDAVNGHPGFHATVWLMPRDSEVQSWSPTAENFVQDPRGAFELRSISPGSYYLIAATSDDGKQYVAREPLDVTDSDVTQMNLTIGPGINLKGRVRVENQAALVVGWLSVALRPRAEMAMGWAEASVKTDGTFVLANVADDTYRIYVRELPEEFYLKAARLGGEDVIASLNVSRSQARGLLDLVLSSNGGQIHGEVLKDHKPFSGATVVLIPDAARRSQDHLYKSTSTDHYGQFRIQGVSPGDYKLFAWEKVEEGAYQDAEFLRSYEDRSHEVHVEEGSQLGAQLEVIPAPAPAGAP